MGLLAVRLDRCQSSAVLSISVDTPLNQLAQALVKMVEQQHHPKMGRKAAVLMGETLQLASRLLPTDSVTSFTVGLSSVPSNGKCSIICIRLYRDFSSLLPTIVNQVLGSQLLPLSDPSIASVANYAEAHRRPAGRQRGEHGPTHWRSKARKCVWAWPSTMPASETCWWKLKSSLRRSIRAGTSTSSWSFLKAPS